MADGREVLLVRGAGSARGDVCQQVLLGDRGLVVGDVLELMRRADVAQGEDAGQRCAAGQHALVAVDGDAGVRQDIDARRGGVDACGVGRAAQCQEDAIDGQRRGHFGVLDASGRCELDADPLVVGEVDAGDLDAEADVVIRGEGLREAGRDLVILCAQEPGTADRGGRARAQPREDVRELHRDVAGAHDEDGFGEVVDAHDGARGVDGRPGCVHRGGVQARDVRHVRVGARGDDDPVGSDLLAAVGDERPGPGEPDVLRDDGRVLQLVRPVVPSGRLDLVDAGEDPIADRGPVRVQEAGGQAQVAGVCRVLRDRGGVHVHLRGDAARVEAGASEQVRLRDRHTQMGEAVVEDRVAGAGADDQHVEMRHAASLVTRRHGLRTAGGPARCAGPPADLMNRGRIRSRSRARTRWAWGGVERPRSPPRACSGSTSR